MHETLRPQTSGYSSWREKTPEPSPSFSQKSENFAKTSETVTMGLDKRFRWYKVQVLLALIGWLLLQAILYFR